MIVTKKQKQIDRMLLMSVLILVVLGILMVYSASSVRGAEKWGDSTRFLRSHVFRVAIGLALLYIVSKVDYHQWRWITPFLLLFTIFLLIFVLFQPAFHGSKRSILFMGKRFQPSELMKLTMIFYLAVIFSKGIQFRAVNNKYVVFHFTTVLIVIGLVFVEPDLGTSLILFGVALTMFFLSGVALPQLTRMALFIPPVVGIGILCFPHQKRRMVDFVQFILGKADMNYQVRQSVIGLAHGGLTGVGYGEGKQKLSFLPEPFSDFILSSLGEELGFLGLMLVFILVAVILWRGIRIALRAPDEYGYLLAGGITAMIMINAVMNAWVVVNLLPTTGLPFPFLSYGGSSMMIHLAGIGVLLNISGRRTVTAREVKLRQFQDEYREDE